MRTYLVPFLSGNGDGEVMLTVTYAHTDGMAGLDGTCAFCHGDPCAEQASKDSHIAKYIASLEADFDSYGWPVGHPYRPVDMLVCPLCKGRPT